jgi:hypothetical protein
VVWEVVFMMVILKIPIVYLIGVVWWAIRAEPRPLEGAAIAVADDPEPRPGAARRAGRPRLRGPDRSPRRVPAGPRRTALARAEARR